MIEIMYQSNYDQRVLSGCCCATTLDKAPPFSISMGIWILSSDTDTDTICQLNQFNTNSEAAMLSNSECWTLLPLALYWSGSPQEKENSRKGLISLFSAEQSLGKENKTQCM